MLPSVTMETEASHMLEAALEQMDDIIAGSKATEFSSGLYDLGSPISAGPLQVVQLAEDLKLALELQPNQEERDNLRAQLSTETAQALVDWLYNRTVNLCSPINNETYQDRLLRLEGDKESLVLQVSVLTDQVEAQGEKIRDLESSLEQHHYKLLSTEGMLQQELLSRTCLETQRLDLMDEVSYLKLKMVGSDDSPPTHTSTHHHQINANMHQHQTNTNTHQHPPTNTNTQQQQQQHQDPEGDKHNNKAEDLMQELEQLKSKVEELEGEKSQYERKLRVTKTEISELQQLLAAKDAEIECLQNQLLSRGTAANDNAERDQEFQRLKMGMESLLASNDEKDRHIEELTVLLLQYRKMREIMALTHGSSEEELTSLKLRALTHKAHSLRSEVSSRGSSPFLLLSPSAFHRELDSSFSCHENMQNPSSSLISSGDPRLLNGAWIQTRILSSSLEELQSASSPKKCHLELNKYQTLPGKLRGGELRAELNGDREQYPSPGDLSPVHRDYSLRRTGAEKHEESFLSDQSPLSSGVESGQQSPVSAETKKTHRGIKKLWGRIRRSQSGSPVQVDDPELGEFRRGGFRATAGPRLARPGTTRDLKTPFSKWTTGQVCDWLDEVGLGQYGILAQHWVTSGQTLLSATTQDLEKEMGVKNPLHRKKLQLIVKTLSSKQTEKSSELDHVWVTRWLDDIGLPQYKDQFNQGRVDGRMLQHLTVNDLLFLRVSSQLHHLSIKCAIHVLHVNRFHPHCLKRRPSHENQYSPSEVVQWSNHRVMEWLRSVDLAEYAPNLRGSGVHGGLIILEPRFNSDTLAMLLNIPAQKTLLRRHLATNFSHLVGSPATLEKREFTEAAGHAPLNPTAKVKPKKLGFSTLTHLRRRRPDDSTDYICPLESPSPPQGSGQTQAAVNGSQTRPPYAAFRGLSPILDRETNGGDQVGLDDDDS